MRPRARWQRDLASTVIALLALLLWDASGADLVLAQWAASADGFALRDAWWTSRLLHDGGRSAAWGVLAAVAWTAWRAGAATTPRDPQSDGPATASSRREHVRWLLVTLACLLLVPALKRASSTSCPWDLAQFGGVAAYVSHWRLGVADGGPGHCFPSGHAVAAFAFLAQFFLWRGHHPARARAWLAGTLAVGAVFGVAQSLRGAHFASHTLWSAWLCWALAVAVAHGPAAWRRVRGLAWGRVRGLSPRARSSGPPVAWARPVAAPGSAPRLAPAAARPGRRADGRRSAGR